MKTIIHSYRFNTTNPDEKTAYDALVAKLKAKGLECFESWGGDSHYRPALDGREVELEDKFLFNNQWNTAPIEGVSEKGLRVFDWAQDYPIHGNRHLKQGHWLEQTEEMRAARRERWACGYTGRQVKASEMMEPFNLDALGSEYLTEKDLPLLRFWPIMEWAKRPPLSDDELALLKPLFLDAQTHGRTERDKAHIAKLRKDLAHKRETTIGNANAEYHGMMWLLDRGIRTDNVIFYSHTGRFCLGWRKALSDDEADAMLSALDGFPFAIDVKRLKDAA